MRSTTPPCARFGLFAGALLAIGCVTEVADPNDPDAGLLADAGASDAAALDVAADAGGRADSAGENDVGAGSDAAVGTDAGAGADAGGGTDAAANPEEARGVWVTRWNYSSADHVSQIVQKLADNGFNQMYFQVRGTADAYYQSTLEPWASRLSGTLGQDPGWDPLQTAIDEAHAVGIEVHAWLNTFAAWSCTTELPQSAGIPHVLESHPEWAAVDDAGNSMIGGCSESYIFLSPGIPAVRDHIAAVVEEIAGGYQVDGIHLDYVRYPGAQFSHDTVSEAAFAEAQVGEPGLVWGDWQRRQVNATVEAAFLGMQSQRPAAVLSAAVWFVYENIWGWSSVSQGYPSYYQDPRAWSAGGYIDAVIPMLYFPLTDPPGERLDFRTLLQDHVDGNAGRHVYAGIEADYAAFDEIGSQVDVSRELAAGYVVFAYTHLEDHAYWGDFGSGPNVSAARPPGMPWR